ncbi:uncharacterized protein LOC128745418 [Sabethes cyaneus]|uniref:uncharacterized protein LOC128745418 n=1 Tax=Sabethes cyaneus TaxID=53552 RepID=UPI00237DDC2B|nr:uncharacterized protein LOC128745418 [Sabethes cyaneus]
MPKRTSAQRKIYPQISIDQLSDNLLLLILDKLPQCDILSASLVCHRWSIVINASHLLDRFILRIIPDPHKTECVEYGHFLSRSERKYRKAEVTIRDQQSFLVAVLALRRFGQYLFDLKLTLNQHCYPSFFQLHFERMKELEMGLEEYDQMLWEQEVDSYDRCLTVIDFVKDEFQKCTAAGGTTPNFRQIEEVFVPFVYRHCFRLKTLLIKPLRNMWDARTSILLYEGVEMKYLTELRIYGAGAIIMADCPLLKSLAVHGTTTGLSFYYGLRNAFPQLNKLEIVDDFLFDDNCLYQVSRKCKNLVELSISSIHNTISQNAFRYIHWLKKLKKLSLSLDGPSHSMKFTFEDWPELKIEKLLITVDELRADSIREILLRNPNLEEFFISTRRKIAFSTLQRLQKTSPNCRLTYHQLTYRQQFGR